MSEKMRDAAKPSNREVDKGGIWIQIGGVFIGMLAFIVADINRLETILDGAGVDPWMIGAVSLFAAAVYAGLTQARR